jgi:hypothetical protein
MAVSLVSAPQVTIAAGGTRQRLVAAPVDRVLAVYVSALSGNVGPLFIGDGLVAVGRGFEIEKGTTFPIAAPSNEMINLYDIWIDGTTGDKVNFCYLIKA